MVWLLQALRAQLLHGHLLPLCHARANFVSPGNGAVLVRIGHAVHPDSAYWRHGARDPVHLDLEGASSDSRAIPNPRWVLPGLLRLTLLPVLHVGADRHAHQELPTGKL